MGDISGSSTGYRSARAWSVLALAIFFLVLQTRVLPSDGFVTGDQGSKFLQARAFADHGPLDPGIDVRARDIDPDYRHQEPKLKNRRGRLVSEFLWLLPLTAAPFVDLFGLRGLYVVPALSALVVFLAASMLGRRLGDTRGVWTGWVAAVATPIVVYGLELWEHAPAAACVMVAAVWLVPRSDDEHVEPSRWPGARDTGHLLRSAGAGAAIAIGALFREEVVMALPALLVARAVALRRDPMRDLIVTSTAAAVGAAAVLVLTVPINLMIYGAPLPMHVTQDAWNVAISTPYSQVRRDVLVDLLLPYGWTVAFVVAVALGAGAAWTRARAHDESRTSSRDRMVLFVVHASVVVLLVVGVALPLWRLAHGIRPHEAYRVTSAAHTWPFAIALLYWPWIRDDRTRAIARYLMIGALLLLIGAALVIPTSGGSQWSPRFLIAVGPLLAVVAAAVASPSARRTPAISWMARVVIAASIVMQVTGVLYVQRTKARHARITHALADRTSPDEVIISGLFWVPQIAATLAPERRLLFAWSPADVASNAALAANNGLSSVAVVTLSELTGHDAPETLPASNGSCLFRRRERASLGELGLMLNRYVCEP